MSLATDIRKIAEEEFVRPARTAGISQFRIPVRELMNKAKKLGISIEQRTPAFCAAIRTRSFLRDNELEITDQLGPASMKSTTLVIHYRIHRVGELRRTSKVETPAERALRLTEKLRGLMKEEIAAHGGAEGYLRWVRGEDEA